MIAYAQVYHPDFPPTWDALYDATVHPKAGGDDALWKEIFEWCDGHVPEPKASSSHQSAGIRCGARIYENDDDKRRQYESRGFRHVRTETLMRVALDEAVLRKPESPGGIVIRRLDSENDMDGYAKAYGEAFRDHWGHLEIPPEEQTRRKRAEFESWGEMFVPDLWFVALDGETIVGSVGGFLNYGNTIGRCYLYHVFVRREWRNRRIAKALLHTAFQSLQARDGRTVELHVDSNNMTYGLELYRGFGMRPVWHQHLYERTVRPPQV
ncbi:MAG: GNAT family N-acetyltransferase [Thermoplasmata archaeon]|nr:GNAT family N-acetyltransferase [Thermoplasmata archaeon]